MTVTPQRSFRTDLKPDMEEAERRWLAFWAHDLVDRPLCAITAPRPGVEPIPPPPYMAGHDGDYLPVARQALAAAETVFWGGEAVPCYSPSFGTDLYATWVGGCDMVFSEAERTSWAVPFVEDWEAVLPIALDAGNRWWRRMLDFCGVLADTFAGRLLVAHLDLHSNMDTLLAMRGGMGLCTDLVDVPDLVDRAMADVRATYLPVDVALRRAGRMTAACGRIPAYHPERTNTIQCDFAALIGPEHFRRWALPALEEEAAHLGRCVMHYDGPEMLVHLDDVLAVDGIECIQWQPGARNQPFRRWLDLLKRIQGAGRAVHVPCTTEEIRVYHRELDPALVYYVCSAASQAEAEATLTWLADHT